MSKLTHEGRINLPAKSFAIPKDRAYPIPDESHARNALARVSEFGDAEEKAQVRSAVARKFPGVTQSKGKKAKKK